MKRLLTTATLLPLLLGASEASTASDACASKPVKATGGTAILESAAKSKARSAWINKVTASRKLGKPYAVWLRAKAPTYSCKKAGKAFVCEASATPCKI